MRELTSQSSGSKTVAPQQLTQQPTPPDFYDNVSGDFVIKIPHADSPVSYGSRETARTDAKNSACVHSLLADSASISAKHHMTLDFNVPSTYPLDHYLSTVNQLLDLPTTSTAQVVSGYHCAPKREFQFPKRNSGIADDDSQYLKAKGALRMPSQQLRDQLLRGYVRYVHPLLPVLDLGPFLHDIILGNESRYESPLLYQAVMLAGSAFVSDEDAMADGFSCRKVLRRTLFERTKLLYEFEVEQNSYTQIQALLLMTNWHGDETDNHKAPCYWLDLAISTAERIGLQPSWEAGSLSVKDRMWWCLYVRDRVLALGFRRPLRIRNIPFESIFMMNLVHAASGEQYHELVLQTLGDASPLLSHENQDRFTVLFIEQVKLAYCLGAILEGLFDEKWGLSPWGDAKYSLVLKDSVQPPIVNVCEELLKCWIRHLPGTVSYWPPLPTDGRDKDADAGEANEPTVHRAYLYILYLTAMSVIYRVRADQASGKMRLRDVTFQVQHTLDELQQKQLLLLLPGTAVTIILLTLEATISDLRGSDDLLRLQAMSNLHACEQFASELFQTYPAAKMVLSQAQSARSAILGLADA